MSYPTKANTPYDVFLHETSHQLIKTEETKGKTLSQRQKLEVLRGPIYQDVIDENPGLTKEQLSKTMDEMGF